MSLPRLARIAFHLLLAPIVLLVLPALFVRAWLHEALADIARGLCGLTPRRAVLPVVVERPRRRLPPH